MAGRDGMEMHDRIAFQAFAASKGMSATVEAKVSSAQTKFNNLIPKLERSQCCDDLLPCEEVHKKTIKVQKLLAAHKSWHSKHTIATHQAFQKAYASACEDIDESAVPAYLKEAIRVRGPFHELTANGKIEDALVAVAPSTVFGYTFVEEDRHAYQSWSWNFAVESYLKHKRPKGSSGTDDIAKVFAESTADAMKVFVDIG